MKKQYLIKKVGRIYKARKSWMLEKDEKISIALIVIFALYIGIHLWVI